MGGPIAPAGAARSQFTPRSRRGAQLPPAGRRPPVPPLPPSKGKRFHLHCFNSPHLGPSHPRRGPGALHPRGLSPASRAPRAGPERAPAGPVAPGPPAARAPGPARDPQRPGGRAERAGRGARAGLPRQAPAHQASSSSRRSRGAAAPSPAGAPGRRLAAGGISRRRWLGIATCAAPRGALASPLRPRSAARGAQPPH